MSNRPTSTLIGQQAREAILKGVVSIFDPVRRTFGPQGKNALLYRTFNRGPRITNDGYTVGDVQSPKNIHVRMAAEAFLEGCKRTNEKVGDGTTCTVIVGGVAYINAHQALTTGQNQFTSKNKTGVMTVRKQILESAEKVKEAVKTAATPIKSVDDLIKIATVSVEDPALGKTIAEMCWKVGIDGFVDVVEGFKGEVETEVIEGARFPAKVPAKGFINNPSRFEMIAENSAVLLTNYELDNLKMVENVFGPLIQTEQVTKLVIMAPKFSDKVLQEIFNLNYENVRGQKVKTNFDFFPVSTPSLRKEQYQDLAVYFDAKFIDKDEGIPFSGIKAKDLGYLSKLVVKDVEAREDAVALGGRGAVVKEQLVEVKGKRTVQRGKEKVEVEDNKTEFKVTSKVAERIEILKGQIKEMQAENLKKLHERRIASLSSASAVIRVGDSTQASSLYMKLKIEDAVFACKAALRSGYVKGGGLCLKEIAETLDEDDILKGALVAPYNQLQSSVAGGVKITDDIIDPAEVPFYAVEHAAQIVANLCTVEIITAEVEDPVHGEGEFAIAHALNVLADNDRRHKGLIKENEDEMENDRMGGLNTYEMQVLDEITGGLK